MRLQESSKEKTLLAQHLQAKEREVSSLESALRQAKKELTQKDDEMAIARREADKLRKINMVCDFDVFRSNMCRELIFCLSIVAVQNLCLAFLG